MGTHHSTAGQTHPAAPGPRQSAARYRKRRTLLISLAAGTALLAVATAAIATGPQPEQGTQAATIPQASTNPLPAVPEHNNSRTDRAHEHTPHQPAATAQGPATTEEPEQDQNQDTLEQSGHWSRPSSADEPGNQPARQSGTCEASFYGDGFHGSTTANGETFDTHAMTAAHKTLPFNTKVEVTNPSNSQSVTVRINDRGPYTDGRCLDLSTAAFDHVIGTGSGVGTVHWQVVE